MPAVQFLPIKLNTKYKRSKKYSRFWHSMINHQWDHILRAEWRAMTVKKKIEYQQKYMGTGYSGFTLFMEHGWIKTIKTFWDALLGKYGTIRYGDARYVENYYNGTIKEKYP